MDTGITAHFESAHRPQLAAFHAFVEDELVPLWQELGEPTAEHLTPEIKGHVRRRSAELGFYAPEYPSRLGGGDLPMTVAALLRHAAGRSGCPLAHAAMAGSEGPTWLLTHGTPQQQQRYLAPLIRAQAMRSTAITEPGTGSDMFRLATRARRVDGGWVLNGHKIFLGNLDRVDHMLVFARGEEAGADHSMVFIVEADTAGLHVRQSFQGMSGEPLFELLMTEVRLPPDAVLGGPEHADLAMTQAMTTQAIARVMAAAECNGLAEHALALGLEHARARTAFGQPIGSFQHVQELLVEAQGEVEQSKLLTLTCALRHDERGEIPHEYASMAKNAAARALNRTVDRSLQVLGGRGWMKGHPLEYLYRYARMMPIVGGTTEIHKVIIAHAMGLGSGPDRPPVPDGPWAAPGPRPDGTPPPAADLRPPRESS
ncbi:acyl-CoA dehydrogenase family protein [Streptomyces sp. NPDC050617]|uniref:acyl-CoA dehydrogenase family protein n=1 Tax=Streptomyces sp. NPDC050617 TaxID=3154628 RepID=UPI0034340F1E